MIKMRWIEEQRTGDFEFDTLAEMFYYLKDQAFYANEKLEITFVDNCYSSEEITIEELNILESE